MRAFVALAVVAVVAGFASADGLIPPPKGKKYVSVANEVLAGQEVKGYVFVIATTNGGPNNQSTTYAKAALDDKKATAVPAGVGKFGSTALVAVPEDAAKEYKTEKELFDALKEKKVKGVHQLFLMTRGTVDEAVKGNKVTWTHTVTGVDDKGITTTVTGDGYEEPKKPLALAEPGTLFGGIALAVGVTLGGLWLVRRKK